MASRRAGLGGGRRPLPVHANGPRRHGRRWRKWGSLGETADEIRRFARSRLDGVRWLKFHVVAWVLGMVVIAPLKALIERQDNGAFERLSTNSQPGSWDPWVVYVGGIWALVIAGLALVVYIDRRRRRAGAATRGDLDRAAKPTNQPLRRFHTLPGV